MPLATITLETVNDPKTVEDIRADLYKARETYGNDLLTFIADQFVARDRVIADQRSALQSVRAALRKSDQALAGHAATIEKNEAHIAQLVEALNAKDESIIEGDGRVSSASDRRLILDAVCLILKRLD